SSDSMASVCQVDLWARRTMPGASLGASGIVRDQAGRDKRCAEAPWRVTRPRSRRAHPAALGHADQSRSADARGDAEEDRGTDLDTGARQHAASASGQSGTLLAAGRAIALSALGAAVRAGASAGCVGVVRACGVGGSLRVLGAAR